MTTLTAMIVFAVLLLVLAVFTTVVGVLAWRMKLPGNGVIGIRVPEVRKSKEYWDTAHSIAGPLWTLAGITLMFGGFLALSATGWIWLLVMITVAAWLVFLGMGAGMAAHTVALMDARRCCSEKPAEDSASDCGVSGGCGSCSLNGACEGGVQIDLDAARRAAAASDE